MQLGCSEIKIITMKTVTFHEVLAELTNHAMGEPQLPKMNPIIAKLERQKSIETGKMMKRMKRTPTCERVGKRPSPTSSKNLAKSTSLAALMFVASEKRDEDPGNLLPGN